MVKKLEEKTELEWAIDRAETALFWLNDLRKQKTHDTQVLAYDRAEDALQSAQTHFKAIPKPVATS